MKSKSKVLVIGTPINAAYKALSIPFSIEGGAWVERFVINDIINSSYDLLFCFFANIKKTIKKTGKPSFVCIPDFNYNSPVLPKRVEKELRRVFEDFNPDLVVIFGTERPYTKYALDYFGNEKVIVSITGIISEISKRYYAGISIDVIKQNMTLGDVLRGRGIIKQKKHFEIRSKNEIYVFKNGQFFSGRTQWDKHILLEYNPSANYYYCNECLRPGFYRNAASWSFDNCEKHTVFMSSGSYPIKGLHFVLKALARIKLKYPNIMLKIAGPNIIKEKTLIDKLKLSNYGKIIKKLIRVYHVEENIHFLGLLDEQQMIAEYQKANCYVMASVIENSSNSLGEAMMIGTPVISTLSCGLSSFLENKHNALTYSFDDCNSLCENIDIIFSKKDICEVLSKNAVAFSKKQFSETVMEKSALLMLENVLSK